MTFTVTVLSAVPPRPSETTRRRTAGPPGPGAAANWDETFPLPFAGVKVPVADGFLYGWVDVENSGGSSTTAGTLKVFSFAVDSLAPIVAGSTR